MLKSLHIGRYVSDPKDLRSLSEFFRAIGFDRVAGEDGCSAILSAPLGLLSLNSLAKDYPEEVRQRLQDVNRLLVLEVSNPDTVFELVEKRKFKLLADATHPKTGERSFSIELPGEIVVTIHGKPQGGPVAMEGNLDGSGKRFGVVVSRFNSFITERLLQGALDGLIRSGAEGDNITVVRVPGSFEIPAAARTLAETKQYDAIVCLGCLLRGGTAHYDVIVNEVTRGIGQSAQETKIPHAFGVLTCDTLEQAIDRAGLKMGNKGFEAAMAAVEMANLKVGVRSQVSGGRKTAVSRQGSEKQANSPHPSAVRKNRVAHVKTGRSRR